MGVDEGDYVEDCPITIVMRVQRIVTTRPSSFDLLVFDSEYNSFSIISVFH